MSILTFNHILEVVGLPLNRVFLLRQQDTRLRQGQTLYRLWRYQPDEFRRYEKAHSERRFGVGDYTASFVIDPAGDVVFAGLSEVMGVELNARSVDFEYLAESHPPGTLYEYQLELDERLSDYEGRLVIDWGAGLRSWCQRAHRQPKPVLELRRTILDVDWPGYMEVRITDREVLGLAPNWQAKLAAASGIYLLTCTETGEQYVGAAYGENGFWGRWTSYANGGDGGNKLLKRRKKRTDAPMQISILEVFGSVMTQDDAYKAESRWKLSLGSRVHGLNAN